MRLKSFLVYGYVCVGGYGLLKWEVPFQILWVVLFTSIDVRELKSDCHFSVRFFHPLDPVSFVWTRTLSSRLLGAGSPSRVLTLIRNLSSSPLVCLRGSRGRGVGTTLTQKICGQFVFVVFRVSIFSYRKVLGGRLLRILDTQYWDADSFVFEWFVLRVVKGKISLIY